MNWKVKPLRYWVAVGILVALVPLAASAVGGFALMQKSVIAPFHDVSWRERNQIRPIQELRILVWDTLIPVDEFVEEGGPQRAQAYRALRMRIESQFAQVRTQLADDPAAGILVERAAEHWAGADALATELVAVERPPGDPEATQLMERFHGAVAATSDTLGGAFGAIEGEVLRDHDIAVAAYERSLWLAAFAAILSVLAMIAGVALIGRVMAVSVDRLVDGASRFAEGDRQHRIDVAVPPELKKVADEFNRMIGRIRDSEDALADLARRDGLTRLLNRRAFDEALAETVARVSRGGRAGALMMMDLDHFKAINDTHGHAAGDDVLRAVAQTLADKLRPFDKAFRIGGEEFAVLLQDIDMDAAADLAERIRIAVQDEPVESDGDKIAITASFGVAKAGETAEPESLVEAADAALYRAKTAGRNRVVLIDETGAHEAGRTGPRIAKLTA